MQPVRSIVNDVNKFAPWPPQKASRCIRKMGFARVNIMSKPVREQENYATCYVVCSSCLQFRVMNTQENRSLYKEKCGLQG